MAEYTVNGTKFPSIEARDTRQSDQRHIAAIDFGTTACSLAYNLLGSDKIKLMTFDSSGACRAPSSILVDEKGQVIAFGKHARRSYNALPKEKKKHHYFFKGLKMNLQQKNRVAWDTTVKALNGKEFFLLEVIAVILKYLKKRLIEGELPQSLRGVIEATDFNWVITVPAMWKQCGKQMMREAAYKAGIASELQEIHHFTEVEYTCGYLKTSPPRILDTSALMPERLSLVHEPEVAALYCMYQAEKMYNEVIRSKCYMVLDIGGGTVDISVHKVTECGAIKVLSAPSGNDWGGTRINGKFEEYLGKLVNDPPFHHYKFVNPPNQAATAKHSAALDEIIYHSFEEQKCLFGSKELIQDEVVINLPYSFVKTYRERLEEGIKKQNVPGVELSEDDLVLPKQIMEEFFSAAISNITACMLETLKQLPKDEVVDTVFFVGGFGGCKYLYEKLTKQIQEYNPDCHQFRPEDHNTAVVSGAVLFRQKPDIIASRVADASYGSSCCMLFNDIKHDEAYKFTGPDRQKRCNHLFVPYVLENDVIPADKLLIQKFNPLHPEQTVMNFAIYTSKRREIKYVVHKDGKPLEGVNRIGELTVMMPKLEGGTSRQVKLTFDFSHTEIQIEAYDLTSNCQATTTVDFLTNPVDYGVQSNVLV